MTADRAPSEPVEPLKVRNLARTTQARQASLSPLPSGERMPWHRWRVSGSRHFIRWVEEYLTITEGTLLGQLVKVHPFQRAILARLLDGSPKPTMAVVSMPRGNGKTALEAMLAVWHAFTVPGAVVIIVATKEEQALIPWQQALDMAKAHPVLARQLLLHGTSRHHRFDVMATGARVYALPSTVRGLQGRRPSLALIDELGFVDDAVWSALALGLGKHRGSQLVGMGTPGFDRGQMWRLRSAALGDDPPRGLEYVELAAELSAVDSPYDPDTIRQANPAVEAGFLDLEAILSNALTESRSDFLTFRLGVWASREESWVRSEDWALLQVQPELPPDGSWVSLGFDGSVGGPGRDTTALVAAQGSNVWVLGYWAAPEGAGKGWRVPRQEVVAELDKALTRWRGQLWADPWHWRTELEQLAERHGDRVVEQNTGARARFGPMVDRFATSVRLGELVHDGHPALQDHVLGAVAEPSAQGTLIRKDARLTHRPNIDLAVAAVLAHSAAAVASPVVPAIY